MAHWNTNAMNSYGTTCTDSLLGVPDVRFGPKKHSRAEENELLNGSSSSSEFKMEDESLDISTADSEDNFLDYEEPIVTCDICKRRRKCSLGEKILLVFTAVCVIIIIALSVAVNNSTNTSEVSSICDSSGCLQAASSLVSAMDPSMDPCEDFHQYACGGWLKETPIQPGYLIWDRFQELSYKNMYILKNLIEKNKLYGSAQAKTKMFYESCMDRNKVSRADTLDKLRLLVDNITSHVDGFNFLDSLTGIHALNTWPLFRVVVGPDERKNDRYVIKLESGDLPFPYNQFPKKSIEIQTRHFARNRRDTEAVISNATANVNSSILVSVNDTQNETTYPTTTSKGDTSFSSHQEDFLKENISELVNTYLEDTSKIIAVIWKMNKTEAYIEARLIFELERRIAMAKGIDAHSQNRFQMYHAVKIKDLQENCKSISWIRFFSQLLKSKTPLSSDAEIIVLHHAALIKTCSIVSEYLSNSTVKSILKRYLELSVIRSLKPYYDLTTFQEDVRPEQEFEQEGEMWRRCTDYTNNALGYATAAIYVNGTASKFSFEKVEKMIEYVKKAFKIYLLHKTWMDEETKRHAEEKINALIGKVSYPAYILNVTFVDEYYKKFVVGDDWLRNLLNWRVFTVQRMVSFLTQKYDRLKNWAIPPLTVTSEYSPTRNDVTFPIGILQLPIYSPDGPDVMNFGALGSLIGHETIHAFDVRGRQYDGYGRLNNWFDQITADMLNTTTGCMKTQYNNYNVDGIAIDGGKTLEENIADNGGVRAALVAYELWINDHGSNGPVPGLHYTDRQLFYISFAQLYCSKWKPEGIKKSLMQNTHSPGPFRIQGALSNSLTFQEVFNCRNTAKYNPATKCQVW